MLCRDLCLAAMFQTLSMVVCWFSRLLVSESSWKHNKKSSLMKYFCTNSTQMIFSTQVMLETYFNKFKLAFENDAQFVIVLKLKLFNIFCFIFFDCPQCRTRQKYINLNLLRSIFHRSENGAIQLTVSSIELRWCGLFFLLCLRF